MKTKYGSWFKSLVWLGILLGVSCGESNFSNPSGEIFRPGLFCDPVPESLPAIHPAILYPGATLKGASELDDGGQEVKVSFGSAVLSATSVSDLSVIDMPLPPEDLELPMDSIKLHHNDRAEVTMTCETLGDPENPCSVTFSIDFNVVDDMILGPSYTCSIVY